MLALFLHHKEHKFGPVLKNPSVMSSYSFPKPNWRTLHHISWAFQPLSLAPSLKSSEQCSPSSRLLIVWMFLIWNIWMWLPLLARLMLEKRLLGAFYSKLVEIAGTIRQKQRIGLWLMRRAQSSSLNLFLLSYWEGFQKSDSKFFSPTLRWYNWNSIKIQDLRGMFR